MKINWKVRLRNKNFWVTVIPIILLLITSVADLFGFDLDLGDTQNKILGIVTIIFLLLGTLGIVNDPTTKGLNDSDRAITYDKPKE